MITYLLIFILSFICTYLLRLITVKANFHIFVNSFHGDSSGHLVIIKSIKKNWNLKRIENYVIPNELHYALGFHRIASFFPLSILEKKSYLPNLIIFSFYSALYFTFLTYVNYHVFFFNNWNFIITAMVLYLLYISNIVFNGPAVTYVNLSERLLSKLSCSMYILGLIVYMEYRSDAAFIISIISGAVCLVSSTFGRQVFLFVLPLLSLFTLNLIPVFSFGLTFILAFIIEGRYFLKSFKGTILYWKIMRDYGKLYNIQNMVLHTNLYVIIDNIKKNRKFQLLEHLIKTEPARLFFYYPELLLSIFFMYKYHEWNYIALIFSIFIIYILTSTKRFAHVGESYRYFEYSLYFFYPFYLAHSLKQFYAEDIHSFYVLLSVYAVYFIFVGLTIILINKPTKDRITDFLTPFLSKINLKESDVIFPIPMQLAMDIASRTNCKVLWWQSGGIIDPKMYEEYIERYPYYKKEWQSIFDKHYITHVIGLKTVLYNIRGGWSYDFSKLHFLYEDDHYIAYTVKNNH